MPTILTILTFFCLLFAIHSATRTLQTCTSSQILNTMTLQCIECPDNMQPNPHQNIATSCTCKPGYIANGINTCQPLGTANCTSRQFYKAINMNGSYNAIGSLPCSPCDGTSQPNQNKTGCVPCGRNMVYSNQSCVCSNPSLFRYTSQGCFNSTQISEIVALNLGSSSYDSSLSYLLPSCEYFSDILSCSYVVNLCTYSYGYSLLTQSQCKYFETHANSTIKNYFFFNSNFDVYQMGPGTFHKNDEMVFRLITYLHSGNLVSQRNMKMTDIFRCGMPSNNSATIKIGNNIQVQCDFDFNNLVQRSSSSAYKNYLYELYLQGADSKYYPVPIYMGSSTTPIRRFYLEDTFTSKTSINIVTSFYFEISLNSSGYLVSPKIYLQYKKLSVLNSAITPSSDSSQNINYQFNFVYGLGTFWSPFIGILIALSVLAFIQALVRTYIAHLNRQSILGFFYYLASFWSLWMFYFLIAISGYWFLFCKTTQDVYIFIPGDSDSFYAAFYVIAGLMGFFRMVTSIYDKKEKLGYQIFMLNSEKGKNSWRQIFIVNSLAQFYTHRTISFFWILLVLMFFMVGLKWQDHAAQVTHIDLSYVYSFNPTNRVFLYFLGATIFLVIGIIFKILRRLSVLRWPYPFEDFVDYCNVTNISFFFMKKRSLQAYYIHASMPDRVEVSFKQINEVIRRGLQKNRNIMNEHTFHDKQKIFSVYISKDIEDKFNNMIKKCEDQEHSRMSMYAQEKYQQKKKSKESHPRFEFIEKKLKPHLEAIGGKSSNQTRSLINRLFGVPPIDLRDPNILKTESKAIFDNNMDIVGEVFPNGNQFEQLHTIIILFLMFLLLTSNVCAAAIITYFIDEYLINGWISNTCRQNLESMTKVREGFML